MLFCGTDPSWRGLGGTIAILAGSALGQTFVPIGPAPVSGYGGASGRVAGIACSRTDPNRLFLATADGGVWRTTDGGVRWVALTDDMPTSATGAVAIDPSDENVIYVGSGEANFANHSRYGRGLYKSIDGGNTWQVLAASTFAGRCFSRIVVHPTQGGILYAAVAGAGGGPERFAAKGHPQRTGPFGVFKSIDGGQSWTLLSGGLPALDATDVRLDPVDPSVLFAGIGHVYGSALNGVYKSIDSGTSWARLGGGLPGGIGGRVSLDVSPANRNRLYAYFANPAMGIGVGGSVAGGGGQLGAFRSDDGGGTWTRLTALPDLMGAQGYYDNLVIAHPTNPDIAFFGGINLRRTDDGGATFTGDLAQHHPDDHAAAFDALGRILIGNDGGVCRSANLNNGFAALNAGLGNMQLYAGISTHPSNETVIFAGLQDNGTARRDSTSSLTWTSVLGGDGGWTQVDQADPSKVYAQSQGAANLGRSTDGGLTFGYVGQGLSGRHAFLPPFLIDPNTPRRMLWANERVFESLDSGQTFSPLSEDLTTGTPFAMRAMAMARADSRRVYVATSDSRVLASADGGRTFALKLTDALGWPRVTREIVVSDADPLTVYLAGARFGQPHVRRSRDGGDTWETLDGDLPDVPVNVIAVDERYLQPRLYAGADDGVYVSVNGGINWSRLGEALPHAAVIDLKLEPPRPATAGWLGGRLLVGTQGRGMWLLLENGSGGAATTNSISLGQVSNGSITFPGQTNFYSFSAASNDVLYLTVLRTNGPGNFPRLYLHDSDGVVATSAAGTSAYASISNLRLTRSGTYTVAVIDNELNETFDYALCMIKVPGPNFPEPGEGSELMMPGETRAAQLAPGDLDAYLFPGVAGDAIWVTMSRTSGAGQIFVQLYGPDGAVVGSASSSVHANIHIPCATNSGTYTVLCADGGLSERLSYTLTLLQTPVPPPSDDPDHPYAAIFKCMTNTVVRWPTNAAGFQLEFCNTLCATNVDGICPSCWTNIPTPYPVFANHYYVTNESSDLIRFYRLRRP